MSGRYTTKLSYRNLIFYGLRSKPDRLIVNENSQAVDGSKCTWDEVNSVSYLFPYYSNNTAPNSVYHYYITIGIQSQFTDRSQTQSYVR